MGLAKIERRMKAVFFALAFFAIDSKASVLMEPCTYTATLESFTLIKENIDQEKYISAEITLGDFDKKAFQLCEVGGLKKGLTIQVTVPKVKLISGEKYKLEIQDTTSMGPNGVIRGYHIESLQLED